MPPAPKRSLWRRLQPCLLPAVASALDVGFGEGGEEVHERVGQVGFLWEEEGVGSMNQEALYIFFRVVSSKHEFAIWPRVLFLTEYANKCNGSAKKGTRPKILVSMKGSKVYSAIQ